MNPQRRLTLNPIWFGDFANEPVTKRISAEHD